MTSVVITISMPYELVQKMDEIALKHYQNRSEFIRETLKARLETLSGEPTQAQKEKELDEYLLTFITNPRIRKIYEKE